MTAAKLLKLLQAEIKKNPEVANYTILWSNADHVRLEVRHAGKWIMIGK